MQFRWACLCLSTYIFGLIFFKVSYFQSPNVEPEDFCNTTQCVNSANEIMEGLNFSADPCVQWLDYVCSSSTDGLYSKSALGANQDQYSQYWLKVFADLRASNWSDSENSSTNVTTGKVLPLEKVAFIYFQQCERRGEAEEEVRSVRDVVHLLEKEFSCHWPVGFGKETATHITTNFQWLDVIAKMNRHEEEGYTPALLSVNSTDERGLEIVLNNKGWEGFTPSKCVTLSQKIRSVLRSVEKNQGEDEIDRIAILNQCLNVLIFSGELNHILQRNASIEDDKAENETSEDCRFTLESLQSKTNASLVGTGVAVNWTRFFDVASDGMFFTFESDNGNETSTAVNICVPQFPKIIDALIFVSSRAVNGSNEEKEAVVNWLYFNRALFVLRETTTLLDTLDLGKSPLERSCFDRTNAIFGIALGKLYIDISFPDDTVFKQARDLVENVKRVGYHWLLKEYTWMENKTTNVTFRKFENLLVHLAQSDWLKGEGVQKIYEKLDTTNFSGNSYARNFLTVNSWKIEECERQLRQYVEMEKSGSPGNRDIFNILIASGRFELVSGFAEFYPAINSIRLGTMMLLPPIFEIGRPGFMNYGGLGLVAAHEMGHMFDQDGRRFDALGNDDVVWDPSNQLQYSKWTRSIAMLYKPTEYHRTVMQVLHSLDTNTTTLNDDIADVLGLEMVVQAYSQYLNDLRQQGLEELRLPIPGRLTPQQLLCIRIGKLFCLYRRESDSLIAIQNPTHSSPNRRARLPLHIKDFNTTFQCHLQPHERNRPQPRSWSLTDLVPYWICILGIGITLPAWIGLCFLIGAAKRILEIQWRSRVH